MSRTAKFTELVRGESDHPRLKGLCLLQGTQLVQALRCKVRLVQQRFIFSLDCALEPALVIYMSMAL